MFGFDVQRFNPDLFPVSVLFRGSSVCKILVGLECSEIFCKAVRKALSVLASLSARGSELGLLLGVVALQIGQELEMILGLKVFEFRI